MMATCKILAERYSSRKFSKKNSYTVLFIIDNETLDKLIKPLMISIILLIKQQYCHWWKKYIWITILTKHGLMQISGEEVTTYWKGYPNIKISEQPDHMGLLFQSKRKWNMINYKNIRNDRLLKMFLISEINLMWTMLNDFINQKSQGGE